MKKCAVFFFSLILAAVSGISRQAQSGVMESGADGAVYGDYYIRPHSREKDAYVVMLPLSSVLSEYGYISLDGETGLVDITCGTLDVSMKIGRTLYEINGEPAELDAPVEFKDEEIYVPASFFEKTFGFWLTDSGEGVVDLFTPGYIIENI